MLEYHLNQFESTNSFVFQIVEQSDRLTNYVKARGVYQCTNGWKVMVDVEPEINIDKKIIYLQGSDKALDHKVDRHWDLKGREAKDVVKAVKAALLEVCSAAKCWKPKQTLNFQEVIIVRPSMFNPFEVLRSYNPTILVVRDC